MEINAEGQTVYLTEWEVSEKQQSSAPDWSVSGNFECFSIYSGFIL